MLTLEDYLPASFTNQLSTAQACGVKRRVVGRGAGGVACVERAEHVEQSSRDK